MKEVRYGLSLKNEQVWDIWKGVSSEWNSKSRHANVGKHESKGNMENHLLPEERWWQLNRTTVEVEH